MRDRVLFVDDDANLLDSIRRNLKRDYQCATAVNVEQAFELLSKEPPFSIVVADVRMPGASGIDFLEKARELCPDTIRIILTGFADMNIAVEAINKAKVFSFLQKPFDSSDLQKVFVSAVAEHRRIRQIHLDSLIDPLTGLYNRRYVLREFCRLIEASRRSNREFALVFSDVNHFKKINDNSGHAVGDDVLVTLAKLYKATARGSDIVCRYGGDEFLILMESANSEHAKKLIDRINAALESVELEGGGGTRVSVSHGYSSFPHDGNDITDLLNIADSKMYENKLAGKKAETHQTH